MSKIKLNNNAMQAAVTPGSAQSRRSNSRSGGVKMVKVAQRASTIRVINDP